MSANIIINPALQLVGISARTTNNEEGGPNGKLPELWNTYFRSSIAERIQANNGHLLYGLYTDYESDASGAYTALLGHERGDAEHPIPEDLKLVSVPEAHYMVFKTKKGPVQEVVLQAWQEIWSLFEHSAIKRAYTGDFELYDTRNFNPNDAEAEIYIAVHPV
ncbi:putative transcriptional regulator YdeE [Paenibacillus castaneae]|uniref:GyrI-like domain-containing protein n=1 Tax=Paenibacillus castaneae TaxID=474957 RepID=UPI000C99B013|nr:GyrI-like domain-containing protein [Paenibacillus castaneae]NIK79114.1 putative transcriptional regulator YdeE [Paenibacillus castaneae]